MKKIINDYVPTMPHQFLKLDGEEHYIYYGIELEIDSHKDKSLSKKRECAKLIKLLDNTLEIKTDPSVSNGFEITTQPATINYIKQKIQWEDIFAILKKYHFDDDIDTAGIHIHVDKKQFSDLNLKKISFFIHSQKQKCQKIARRKDNIYCRYKKVSLKNQKDLVDKCYSGSEAINFSDNYKRNTFEIRIFKSTLTASILFATLEFVDSICSFVKHIKLIDFKNKTLLWQRYYKYICNKTKQGKYFYLRSYVFSLGLT